MRPILLLAYICITFACSSSKMPTKNPYPLNGSWKPVRQEMGGENLPAEFFQKQVLVMKDNAYTFTAESVDKGKCTYDDRKMDIYGKEGINTGKHFSAIYKLEADQLTICYNLQGDSYPKDFTTTPKSSLFLCIFKKDKTK